MNQLFSERHEFRVTAFSCSFCVYGKPEPGGSKTYTPNARTKVRDSNKNVGAWKQEVGVVAGTLMRGRAPYEGPLSLMVKFYLKRPKGHYGKYGVKPSAEKFPIVRPDATKLLRPLEDALNGIIWKDDSQVVSQVVTKNYCMQGEEERAEVRVTVMV